MYTWNDFEDDRKNGNTASALDYLLQMHQASDSYRIAKDADTYDRQMNSTISKFVKKVRDFEGFEKEDTASANNRLCSNFFRSLNVERNMYSLGNGVQFDSEEDIKEKLGKKFDTKLKQAGYYALIHGISFLFWNVDHVHVFKLTEFAPLWDEETGVLKAGVRYWQIDVTKPVYAVLYEEDGYTKFRKSDSTNGGTGAFEVIEDKRAYRVKYRMADVDSEPEIIGEENYSSLPIIPLYASNLKQSTLIGMKGNIDAYDLVNSGFANDMQDCSQIYWILNNAGGMDSQDLQEFLERLKNNHIASMVDDEVNTTPYTQEIPYQSRKEFKEEIRNQIYEDFCGLDVHTISAGATNDHIEAGYQPMDNVADDYEYQIIEAVEQLTELVFGEAYTPLFKRNKISNQKEQTDMIIECANYLDDETILNHLPFLTPDEVDGIIERKEAEDYEQFKDDSDTNLDDSSDDSNEDGLDIITE